jgi:hypothetical protein
MRPQPEISRFALNLSNFATNSGTPLNNEIRILLDHVAEWIVGHSSIVA